MPELTTLPAGEKLQLKTPEKNAGATPEKKPQPQGPTEAKMGKLAESINNPDKTLETIKNLPDYDETLQEIRDLPTYTADSKTEAPEDRLAQATNQLTSARKAFVEKGYGIKGLMANTEQAKYEYRKALNIVRQLKMDELRKKLDENPQMQEKQVGQEKSHAELLIESTMHEFSIGEFTQLQQVGNDLWSEHPGTKFTETTKNLLDKYKKVNRDINDWASNKLFGVDEDSSWLKKTGASLSSGSLINIGVSAATLGIATIPMRVMGGALAAEAYRKIAEDIATDMRRKSTEGKIQEVLQKSKGDDGKFDFDKIDFFLDNQIHDIGDQLEGHKMAKFGRDIGAYIAAYGSQTAARVFFGWGRHQLADTEIGQTIGKGFSDIRKGAKEMFDVKNFVGSAEGADLRPTKPKGTAVIEKPAATTPVETTAPKPAITAEQIATKQNALAGVKTRLNDARAVYDAAEAQYQEALKNINKDLRFMEIADRYKQIRLEKYKAFIALDHERINLESRLSVDKKVLAEQQEIAKFRAYDKQFEAIKKKVGLTDNPEKTAPPTGTKGQEVLPTTPEEWRLTGEKLTRKIDGLYDSHYIRQQEIAITSGENRAILEKMLAGTDQNIVKTEAQLALAQQESGTMPEYAKVVNKETTIEQLKFFRDKMNFISQAHESPEASVLERQALANKAASLSQGVLMETNKRIDELIPKIGKTIDTVVGGKRFDEYQKIVNDMQDALKRITEHQGGTKTGGELPASTPPAELPQSPNTLKPGKQSSLGEKLYKVAKVLNPFSASEAEAADSFPNAKKMTVQEQLAWEAEQKARGAPGWKEPGHTTVEPPQVKQEFNPYKFTQDIFAVQNYRVEEQGMMAKDVLKNYVAQDLGIDKAAVTDAQIVAEFDEKIYPGLIKQIEIRQQASGKSKEEILKWTAEHPAIKAMSNQLKQMRESLKQNK